jgi:hypothetical protein
MFDKFTAAIFISNIAKVDTAIRTANAFGKDRQRFKFPKSGESLPQWLCAARLRQPMAANQQLGATQCNLDGWVS